jgi:hypothetical protein
MLSNVLIFCSRYGIIVSMTSIDTENVTKRAKAAYRRHCTQCHSRAVEPIVHVSKHGDVSASTKDGIMLQWQYDPETDRLTRVF